MVTPPRTDGSSGQNVAVGALSRSCEDALEHALRGIEAAGDALVSAPRSRFDLRPLARALEQAATAIFDAYDARREVGAALDEAIARCDDAAVGIRAAAEVDEGLEPVIVWVNKVADWLRTAVDGAGRSFATAAPPRDVVASLGTPALHRIHRETLAPHYAVAIPLPPLAVADSPADPLLPLRDRMAMIREQADVRRAAGVARRAASAEKRDQERLRSKREVDAPVPGFVSGPHRSAAPEVVVRDRARECFEEVAALGLMRIPLLGDPWRTTATLDARMLTAVDAVAAMGTLAITHLEKLVFDAPVKDPSRAFAIAMIAGCFEGRDTLAAVERSLRFLGLENRDVLRRAAEALALAPHPGLSSLLRRWLAAEEGGLRAIAIDVLARRGEATVVELERALGDEHPFVIEKALVPAALLRVPNLPSRVEELSQQTHEGIAEPLAWSIVLGDIPYASTRLGEWLGTAREGAALVPLAVAGDRDDASRLVALSEKTAKRPRVDALGWTGAPDAIIVLLRLLREAKDDELKLSVAFALDRITGARLYEDSLVPPEQMDVHEPDEPEDPALGIPLARDRRGGDPRDLPAEGSPDRATLPSIDPTRWEAWLASHPDKFNEKKRYRRGREHSAAVSLEELDREALVSFERRVLHRELVIKTGFAHPFDPHAFVPVQEAQLDGWAEAARRGSSQPGSWSRAQRR